MIRIFVLFFPRIKQFQNIKINNNGYLSFNWKKQLVKTRLVGGHYLSIIAAIIAVCQKLGLSDSQIASGLCSFKPSSMFIKSYILKNGALVIDDGRSTNPKGFKAAIELCNEVKLAKNRKILITGGIVDLGQESSAIHHELAKLSKKCFDIVIYTDNNELDEFKKEFKENQLITEVKKIREIIKSLNNKDLVLIEGKLPLWIRKLIKDVSNI